VVDTFVGDYFYKEGFCMPDLVHLYFHPFDIGILYHVFGLIDITQHVVCYREQEGLVFQEYFRLAIHILPLDNLMGEFVTAI
jgi:hypothetical protein